MLSMQELRSQQLQLEQVCYTQLPENSKLLKIARLYANVFAELPWNEYKVCQNGHFFGRQQSELTSCTNCSQPLKIAYPEEETVDYITKEVTNSEGTLITFEDESGEVLAAGWGYACTTEELQAKYNSSEMKKKVVSIIKKTAEKAQRVFYLSDEESQAKYDSSEMKKKVVNIIKKSAENVQRVFYLSEIMVDTAVRKRGIATKITKCLFETAQSLNLNLVMRTRSDSPMVQIANNIQMSQVIGLGEDTDNPKRVLYIKI